MDQNTTDSKKKDYYTALSESPNPPNSSVGTIKADQSRINFDLDVIGKSHHLSRMGGTEYLSQPMMQKKFSTVM